MSLGRTLIRFIAMATCGLLIACSGKAETPIGPTPNNDTFFYAAIGASDANGVGGSVVCAGVLDCPNGTGYVYLLKRQLQTPGKTVILTNLGVPGSVLSPAIEALARQVGDDIRANFIENQVPFVAPTTTHFTVFAGGNDANVIARAIRAGLVGSDTPNDIRAYVDRHVQDWGAAFDDLLRRVRARAPNARIVAYNLPNLAGLPYVSRNTTYERSIIQRIAVGLSDRISAAASQNVLVVDLLCEPRLYNPTHVSSDGFHPSDQGYQLMAELGYPLLSTGTGPRPSLSCPQRTLLPAF